MSIHTSITPRQSQPNPVESPAASPAVAGIVKSRQNDFGPAGMRSNVRSGIAAGSDSGPVNAQAHRGAPVFSKGFSKNFGRAYTDALAALKSPENLQSFRETGRLSPAACKAAYRLVSVVALKSSEDHASVNARWAFKEDKLSPEESAAWMSFLNRLPASFKNADAPSSTWKPVSTAELAQVLAQDNALAKFIDQPEGQRFVTELAQALNAKSTEMTFSDKGLAFTMQFAHAYGTVNHISGGSFWRDGDGQLQMAIIHQESLPPTKASGGIAVGRVFPHLDTQQIHPEKRGTMVESIKLNGMPTVNLFPCAAPEAVVPLTQMLVAVGDHPYGPTEDWNNNNRGNLPPARAFECCFDVTIRALSVMHNLMAERVHLLPDSIERMQAFANIPAGSFETVDIKTAKGSKTVKVADMRQLEFKDQYAVFKEVGQAWGRDMPWDVNRQTDSEIRPLMLQPGQQGIRLEPGQRFKFIDRVQGLTLDGVKVGPEKAYTAEEASRMVYAGDKPVKATVVVTKPAAATHAKL